LILENKENNVIDSITDCTKLNNGLEMPWLGFGVFLMEPGDETEVAVRRALDAGYRSIDTAAIYNNEAGVGKAIKESGFAREELFITTKLWNADQGYDSALKAFDESMEKLQLEVLDLYLIHWPVVARYKDSWKALEKLYKDGRVKAIGLSNFQVHHIQDILEIGDVVPTVNQVEFHPKLRQAELHNFCIENKIQLQAWAPLMQGKALDIPELVKLGEKYGKSPAQILIRWDLQLQVLTIPKSITPHRIVENCQVFDFHISDQDMAVIDNLNKDERVGPDPDNFDF
jgi:diketogulonate reductase-like aldo/keto reductase